MSDGDREIQRERDRERSERGAREEKTE